MSESESSFFSFLDHFTFVQDDSSAYEIGIGDNGFSYLDRGSEKKAAQVSFQEKQRRETSAALDGSTRARGKFNIRKVDEIDHDAVCLDTNLESIIQDLQERKNKQAFFPIAIGVVLVMFIGWCFLPHWLLKVILGLPFFISVFLLLLNVWKLDVSRRNAKVTYRFSGSGSEAFQAINHSLEHLAASDQLLLLKGRKHFEDTRYSGGAKSLPVFVLSKLNRGVPPLIEMDSPVWHFRLDRRDLYFMPDHLMVFDGANIGGIGYSNLKLRSSLDTAQARDTAKRTSDSKVVGSTFRFVNNDRTPDQRFNNNVKISIIEYGVFSLSGSGLDLNFYVSKQRAGTSASGGFEAIQRLSGKPVVKVAEQRRQHAAAFKADKPDIYQTLLDAMCCVMVSDGRLSSSEKAQIASIMTQVKSPYSPENIKKHISKFCDRVQTQGFTSILVSVCEDAIIFKEKGKVQVLLSSLESVAKADGVVQDKEQRVIERFRAVVQ